MMRKDIPDLVGKRIQCINLKQQPYFNGKVGYVLEFCPTRERYKVDVQLGEIETVIRYFKAKNLYPFCDPYYCSMEFKTKLDSLLFIRDFKEGLQTLDWLDQNRDEDVLSQIEIITRLQWLDSIYMRFLNVDIVLECINQMENLLKMCDSGDEDLAVQIKLSLARAWKYIPGNKKSFIEILEGCLENHFGFLPHIVELLVLEKEPGIETEKLYFLAENFIKTNNFDCRCYIPNFYCCMINHFFNAPTTEFKFYEIIERLSDASILPDEEDYMRILCLGRIFYRENYLEKALEYAKMFEHIVLKLDAVPHLLIDAYQLLFLCYLRLNRKECCQDALKKLKTLVSFSRHVDLSCYEIALAKSEEFSEEVIVEKCTNCQKNVENRIENFSFRETANYCSKKCRMLDLVSSIKEK